MRGAWHGQDARVTVSIPNFVLAPLALTLHCGMALLGLIELPAKPTMIGLLGGLLLLYAAAQALVSAMGGANVVPPWKRALSQWIGVAITTVLMLFLGRSDLAVGIVLATSVASLALGVGAVAASGALENATPGEARKLWPFVLPTGLLALLAGFSAQLNWVHAIILLVEGLVLLAMQMDGRVETREVAPDSPSAGAPVAIAYASPRPRRLRGWIIAEWILGLLVAVLGGYMAAHFTASASKQVLALSGTAISTVVLGPGLVLPMLGRGTTIAQEGRAGEAVTSYVIFTLLNLCLLLPAIALLGYVAPWAREFVSIAWHMHSLPTPSIMSLVESAKPIGYPLAVWRLDTVILVVMGLVLVPISQSRMNLGRREGLAIVLGYWLYLLFAVALAGR